jgi:2'-hydroxyisoflavone reductase
MASRRQFLGSALGAGFGAIMPNAFAAAPRAARPLDILILGGTGFLGPHEVEPALARGHAVTLFNRGITAAGRYGNRVETLIGDRDSRVGKGLEALAGSRRWDLVIDNSGFVPRHVRDSAMLLKGRVGRYLFVSTISAYELEEGGTFNEDSPLWRPDDPDNEQGGYGPMKAVCDRIVREVMGEDAIIVRPTYIVGPGDDTDRFTYWIDRLSRGGDVLGPPDPGTPFQWIDARDLGAWILQLAEQGTTGIFNAASEPRAWGQVLAELAAASGKAARIRPATEALLDELAISLPLVFPDLPAWVIGSSAARTAGLRLRPLADTARDTLAWWRSQSPQRRAASGWLTPERERQALRRLPAG